VKSKLYGFFLGLKYLYILACIIIFGGKMSNSETKEKEFVKTLREYLEDTEKIIEVAKVLQQQAMALFREKFTSDLVVVEIDHRGKLCVAVKSAYGVDNIKYDYVVCRDKLSEEDIPKIAKRHIENVFKSECLSLINFIIDQLSKDHKKVVEALRKMERKEYRIPPIMW